MTCPECGTENHDGGKFCRSCGIAMENTCNKCGHTVSSDDRFCTSCGQSTEVRESSPHSQRSPLQTKQYSPLEISDLLTLRKSMRKEDSGSKTFNQDDVDQIFG
jgi:uncharacterized membrane protein YvbJ